MRNTTLKTLWEYDPGSGPTGPSGSPSSDVPAQIHYPHLHSHVPDQRPGSLFCRRHHGPSQLLATLGSASSALWLSCSVSRLGGTRGKFEQK